MMSHKEPRSGSIRRALSLGFVLSLLASLFTAVFVASTAPANATGTTTGGDCTHEYVRHVDFAKYKKTIPAVAGVKEYKYKKEVKTYKTQHWAKYQKHVKGKVQKKINGSWVNYGTFGYEKWQRPTWNTDGSFKLRDWADTVSPDVIEEGGHNDTSLTYTSGSYTYRKISERYQYYVIDRDTRQVETGSTWEVSDWTTEVRGAPWIKVGERWKTEPVPAYDVYYVTGGGSTTTNTDANWTRDTPGSPWVKFDQKSVKEGPVRSATEPPRGNYPDVPWTKVPGSEVCPGGQSNYVVNCESITLNAPTGVTPVGSESRYLIDGTIKPVGTHVVSAGDHIVTLEVKVNGAWKKVDEDKVKVEVCPSGGTSKYETTCNTLMLYAPMGVLPQGGESRYLLDGVVKTPGTYTLPAGSYELTLEVKVNGTWRQVDKDTVVIEDCVAKPMATVTVDCNGFVVNMDNKLGTAEATFVVTKPDGTTETVKVPAGQTASRTYPVIEDQTATVTVKSSGMQDVSKSYTADCKTNLVPVPADEKSVDKCNAPGVTNNVEWAAPLLASTETITWTQSDDGRTRTATLVEGRNSGWTDGTSAPKVWTLPADSGELCPTPPPPPVPPTPPSCPPGSTPTDINKNGVIEPDLGECVPPTPVPPTTPPPVPPTPEPTMVKGKVTKVDKCGRSGDYYKVTAVNGGDYLVKGKVVREGVLLKAGKVVKVTFVADNAEHKVVGKRSWTLRFTNKPCGKPPVHNPPTGK